MMNHHMPAGPGQQQQQQQQQPPHIAPAMPLHPRTQRHQDYQQHSFHHGQMPQSPIHHNPYSNYHHPPPQFYPHMQQSPYQQPRWQGQHVYHQQQYMPPPQMQPFQPRSPMVVTSQPYAPSMHRQASIPQSQPQASVPSPRSTPQNVQYHAPQAASISPAPTPKQDLEVELPPTPSRRQSQAQSPLSMLPEHKTPYYPSLPWYSTPNGASDFPARAPKSRRHRQNLRNPSGSVALPARDTGDEEVQTAAAEEEVQSETSTIAAPSEQETPATSQAPSESDFAQVSTPVALGQAAEISPKVTPTQLHARKTTRTAIAIPNISNLPKTRATPPAAEKQNVPASEDVAQAEVEPTGEQAAAESESPAAKAALAAPKSWADLMRTKETAKKAASSPAGSGVIPNGVNVSKSASLAEALRQYNVENDASFTFLEPRGLINTGNMCYMNSILQVLVFCAPFYSFLDQVRQRTVHSMKSDTPLIDAMIMFMREFKVLANGESVDSLRKELKQQQLEQYGEAVVPEYVYEAIRLLPRFQSMRRGHQQDAEEFLGFLLEGLHDECEFVMNSQPEPSQQEDTPASGNELDGWEEVGPKQKSAVTRTAGQQDVPSPITKIFGGHLRSELRVPGLKDSVTLEPYKPLQLDIGEPGVNNIVDALKGLTHTEVLTGEFGGRADTAKKQVFIDTLPPVLILHLKRFQYDSSFSGTQKIWKKVGYPLELEIPKDVLAPAKRNGLALKGGAPRYRLISVVYHHGKSAAGGHYTVDVLRQDSREWVRMDDTHIRRIRPEDVAEGGAEEDPKVLSKALEQHKADQDLNRQRNMYQGLDEDDRVHENDAPWSEVNGHVNHSKKLSSVAAATNGTATPSSTAGKRTPTAKKESVKDNKVAYILLYEQIRD